jgi:uncharacterized protein YndB with AHSA1/START domain
MPAADAKLEEVDGRPALRFERVLPHPPQRVWRALTEPEEMFAWHPTPARFEPRPGGRVEWDPKGHVPDMETGEVTDYDPPRTLGYTWGVEEGQAPDHLRWELRPHDGGCLLVLVHSFSDRFKAARDGAGWHLCLDSLADSLGQGEGAGAPSSDSGRWQALNARYQERFGISPEQATPPPSRG